MKSILNFMCTPRFRFWLGVGALISVVWVGLWIIVPVTRVLGITDLSDLDINQKWYAPTFIWLLYFSTLIDVLASISKSWIAVQIAAQHKTPLTETLRVAIKAAAIDDDAPIINVALEDALAYAPTEEDRHQVLVAWLMLGSEYAAREMGRQQAAGVLEGMLHFVKTAQPSRPWRD